MLSLSQGLLGSLLVNPVTISKWEDGGGQESSLNLEPRVEHNLSLLFVAGMAQCLQTASQPLAGL